MSDIQAWLSSNFLKLNPEKTEMMVLGSRHNHSTFQPRNLNIDGHATSPSSSARNLGVVFDHLFNMEKHVSSICRSANFHLRNVRRIRKYMSKQTTEQIIHALVTSRLDCCNALLVGVPSSAISRLQRVHNNAARVLTN